MTVGTDRKGQVSEKFQYTPFLIFELYEFFTYSKTLNSIKHNKKEEMGNNSRLESQKFFPSALSEKWMLIVPCPGPGVEGASLASVWEEAGNRMQISRWLRLATVAWPFCLVTGGTKRMEGWGQWQARTHLCRALPTFAPRLDPDSLLLQLLMVCGSRGNQTAQSTMFTFSGSCPPSTL